MALKLIDDAEWVLKRAWSVRLLALAIVFNVLNAVVPFMDGLLPQWLLAVLALVSTLGAIVMRFVKQKDVQRALGDSNG